MVHIFWQEKSKEIGIFRPFLRNSSIHLFGLLVVSFLKSLIDKLNCKLADLAIQFKTLTLHYIYTWWHKHIYTILRYENYPP